MEPSDWVASAVGILALALSTAAFWRTLRQERVVRTQTSRLAVLNLMFMWNNRILSSEHAVRDDNWDGLIDSAKGWRAEVHNVQAAVHRAREPLGRAVAATKTFEDTVRPLAEKRKRIVEGHLAYEDPYEDRIKVHGALSALQSSMNLAMSELESLSHDDKALNEH